MLGIHHAAGARAGALGGGAMLTPTGGTDWMESVDSAVHGEGDGERAGGPASESLTGETRAAPESLAEGPRVAGPGEIVMVVAELVAEESSGGEAASAAEVEYAEVVSELWHKLHGYRRPVEWCEQPDRPVATRVRGRGRTGLSDA